MTDNDYRKTLEAARTELDKILNKEAEFERLLREARNRSEKLHRTVISLSALVGEDGEGEATGITDAIRQVLESNKQYALAPTTVRTYLERQGFPVGKYKNALAVIHTTLKRLADKSEIAALERDGKTLYRWREPDPSPDFDDEIPF